MGLLTKQIVQEDISKAYAMAVSALASCSYEHPTGDRDGVDFYVKSRLNNGSEDESSVLIAIQAKASINITESNGRIPITLTIEQYLSYKKPRTYPLLLILLALPKQGWCEIKDSELCIREKAYWVNPRTWDYTLRKDQKNVNVHFPVKQIFNTDSLEQIFQKVQALGVPDYSKL
jgi:hypothetical protein